VETIAVYREKRVKVYGITEKPGLCLGVLQFPSKAFVKWGNRIKDLKNDCPNFELVTYHLANQDRISLHLVFEKISENSLKERVHNWLSSDLDSYFDIRSPVDLIYLHGPHFQDRDGIAEIAFTALKKNKLDPIVIGCAGTSMYIITPNNQGGTTSKLLSDTFLIPTSK
jgi:aspartokinase